MEISLRSRHVIPTPVRDIQAHSIFKIELACLSRENMIARFRP